MEKRKRDRENRKALRLKKLRRKFLDSESREIDIEESANEKTLGRNHKRKRKANQSSTSSDEEDEEEIQCSDDSKDSTEEFLSDNDFESLAVSSAKKDRDRSARNSSRKNSLRSNKGVKELKNSKQDQASSEKMVQK